MKKIWLTCGASLLLTLTAVHAQDRDTQQSQDQNTEQSTEYRSTDSDKASEYSWRDEDKESITQQDLPQTLLETLKSDQYAGWENATIYRNRSSQEYMLVVQEGSDVKTFYFDSEGQERSQNGTSGATGSSEYGTSGAGSSESQGQYGSSDSNTDSQSQYGTSGSESAPSSSDTTGMSPSSTMPPEAGSDYNSGSSSSESEMNSGQSDDMSSTGQTQSDMSSSDQTSSPRTSSDNSSSSGSESSTTTTTTPPESYPTTSDTEVGAQGESGMAGQEQQTSGTSGSSSELQTEDPSTSWNAEDRVIVVREEIPATLLVTLEDDRYEGWENSTVYRNNKTGDFMIEVRDGSSTKVYHFDAEGKERSEK